MGNHVSSISAPSNALSFQAIEPVMMPRTGKEKFCGYDFPSADISIVTNQNILKTAFSGVWSIDNSAGVSPQPRVGHFSAVSQSDPRNVYIGYGTTAGGECLNDCWCFNLDSKAWLSVPLSGDFISPRNGSKACFVGGVLYVFGGQASGRFFSDLHTINVKTGEVKLLSSAGSQPLPRSDCYFACTDCEVFVFGGYNNAILNDLFVYSLENGQWSEENIEVNWSTTVPYTQTKDKLFAYAGSKGNNLFTLDLITHKIDIKPCQGSCPVFEPINGGLIYVNGYLFCFGGKNKSNFTLVYSLDIENLWWFVYHIVPDNETATVSDGFVSNNGLFLLPSCCSFTVVYDEKSRTITSLLGYPLYDPPPISKLSLGQSLPIISLRKDMMAMLR